MLNVVSSPVFTPVLLVCKVLISLAFVPIFVAFVPIAVVLLPISVALFVIFAAFVPIAVALSDVATPNSFKANVFVTPGIKLSLLT